MAPFTRKFMGQICLFVWSPQLLVPYRGLRVTRLQLVSALILQFCCYFRYLSKNNRVKRPNLQLLVKFICATPGRLLLHHTGGVSVLLICQISVTNLVASRIVVERATGLFKRRFVALHKTLKKNAKLLRASVLYARLAQLSPEHDHFVHLSE